MRLHDSPCECSVLSLRFFGTEHGRHLRSHHNNGTAAQVGPLLEFSQTHNKPLPLLGALE